MASSFPYILAALAAILLLFGFLTPIAGLTIAIAELWVLVASGTWLPPILLAGLGITAAMIGPGMWSIDAHLYGRKHLQDVSY